MTSFNRPPGFYDRPPTETENAARTIGILQQRMARFGYRAVETPLVEYADLFLTKAGDDAVNRLFFFELHGQQLCLRSEFTAPAARLYVEQYQAQALPIRWQMAGPVFRYDAAGHNTLRQVTMLGGELLGAAGANADAEAIGMAAQGLEALGITPYHVVVGHIGLLGKLLDQFQLDRRIRQFMLNNIENLRRADRGRAYVEAQLALLATVPESTKADGLAEIDSRELVQSLLRSSTLQGMGRTREDIARRLLTKQQRSNQRQELTKALDYLSALVSIQGSPNEAFADLERLLPSDPEARQLFDAFRQTIELTLAYGIPEAQIRIQMDTVRGLNYYTGIVFDLLASRTDSRPLCGGGRYDDLIQLLGAEQAIPAVGLAYDVDAILTTLQAQQSLTAPPRVLIIPQTSADAVMAIQLASQLRAVIDCELHTESVETEAALRLAQAAGTRFAVVVGAERTLHDVRAQSSRTLDDRALLAYFTTAATAANEWNR